MMLERAQRMQRQQHSSTVSTLSDNNPAALCAQLASRDLPCTAGRG